MTEGPDASWWTEPKTRDVLWSHQGVLIRPIWNGEAAQATPVINNGKIRQSKRDSDNENDSESMTSLDMENEELDDEENNDYGIKKSVVKLSKILPQPVNVKSRNSTPASSSRKGMQR